MKWRILTRAAERTFVIVLETGDEVIETLSEFADEHKLTAARFTAIGAFEDLVLGYFDPERKKYQENRIREQVEVLSLIGNVALKDAHPKLHAHVVVGKRDGTAHGGHLLSARVRPTLEIVLIESPIHLQRRFDEATGLALLDPGARMQPHRRGRPLEMETASRGSE